MTKITFLGTADSIPSASRNHTSILLTIGSENVLVDCGEGTQRQFRKAKLNPGKITRILISHWHGDHVLGLPGLLSTLSLSGYKKKLYIYGPIGTKKRFFDMLKVFSFVLNYEIIFKEIGSGKFFESEDFYLEAREMDHSVISLAYNFVEKGHVRIRPEKVKELGSGPHLADLKKGKDIVIRGRKIKSRDCVYKEDNKKVSIVLDTKNNRKIIPFVKEANAFICEGTFSDVEKKEAKEKMHMTVLQAGSVASKAKVKKLFVTHVSSRYLKEIDFLKEEVRKEFSDFVFPKDLDSFEI